MKKQILLFSTLALVSSLSFAQGVPNTFSAGQPARAADVNENFTSIIDLIDASVTDIATNTSNISSLQSTVNAIPNNSEQVTSNTAAIQANITNITALQSSVSSIPNNTVQTNSNTAATQTNSTSIGVLQSSVAAIPNNTAQVNNNTDAIAANTNSITTNSENISANTNSIATNSDSISANSDAASANTSDIVNNETAISALSNQVTNLASTTPASDYQGFAMPFSAPAEERNTVILRRQNDDGSVRYTIRMSYQDSGTETLLINDAERTFEYFFVYGGVTIDAGIITGITKSIEGMDDTTFNNYVTQSTEYDPGTLEPLYLSSNEASIEFTGEGANINALFRIASHSDAGTTNTAYLQSRQYTLTTNYQANGIDFGDTPVRIEYRSIGSSRIRVKGIGVVEFLGNTNYGTSPSTQVIYYNVNGQTAGNLTGTPFESGSDIYNLFF